MKKETSERSQWTRSLGQSEKCIVIRREAESTNGNVQPAEYGIDHDGQHLDGLSWKTLRSIRDALDAVIAEIEGYAEQAITDLQRRAYEQMKNVRPLPPETITVDAKRCTEYKIVAHRLGHWCGYVRVSTSSILHGKDYREKARCKKAHFDALTVNDIGAINAMSYGWVVSDDGWVYGDLADFIPAPQGLTFAGHLDGTEEGSWWFGFDTAHAFDEKEGRNTEKFATDAAIKLAEFLDRVEDVLEVGTLRYGKDKE